MPDPLTAWRDLVAQLGQAVNRAANSAMASERYRDAMNRMLLGTAATQEYGLRATQRLLAALDIPTQDDVAALGERLYAIEQQLRHLGALLEIAHPAAAVALRPPMPSPPRTRKPSPPAEPAAKRPAKPGVARRPAVTAEPPAPEPVPGRGRERTAPRRPTTPGRSRS